MEAIILAGGLGTRLRSVVSDVPKCMAPVGARPFLSVLLDQLAAHQEIHKVILSVGYLREVIMDWISENGSQYPFSFDFAVEQTPLGTGGGIKLALGRCSEDQVLILNGDTYFDIQPQALASAAGGAALSVALKPMSDFDRYGAVKVSDDGIIREFCEKRHCSSGLINGGVYLVRRSQLDLSYLPEKFSFEKDVLEPMAAAGKLRGVVQDGYFIDIGIPDDYAVAQLRWGGWNTLLLDRDGVINTLRPGDYVKDWSEFEFRPRFMELIPQWAEKFERILIVTNQRGVGRGKMSPEDLDDIHDRMNSAICGIGGRIDGIYCCTAVDDSDPRRKPNIGMWREIMKDYPDLKAEGCVMLGDSETDMAFADNCGIHGIKANW